MLDHRILTSLDGPNGMCEDQAADEYYEGRSLPVFESDGEDFEGGSSENKLLKFQISLIASCTLGITARINVS
jgi:hypothetical protein